MDCPPDFFRPRFNGKVTEIRAMGYTPLGAILELTDNSVRKMCLSKKVRTILHKKDTFLDRISVIDDGIGMSFEKLCQAFIFNFVKPREEGDIGKFHVGMKYSQIVLGSQITILSRVTGGQMVGLFADIDQMIDSDTFVPTEKCSDVDDTWALRHVTSRHYEEFKASDSGTFIHVANLTPMCRRPFDKIASEIGMELCIAYKNLYNDCQIILENDTTILSTITPYDLFYTKEREKLDEDPYETLLKIYTQGPGLPERVIEINTSSRFLPNGSKQKTKGSVGSPAYYGFTEYEHRKGRKNNMEKIKALPSSDNLISSIHVRIIQTNEKSYASEKNVFPDGSKLAGDRKVAWFNREIRCVGAAKQLGHKFHDRTSMAAERQRMLVTFSESADNLVGSKFNKQMGDDKLPCSALNDALHSIYKQVTTPWCTKWMLQEEQAVEEPVVEEQAVEEQAVDEQAVEENVVVEPVVEEQAVEEQAVEEQAVEEPVVEENVVVEPVVENAFWNEMETARKSTNLWTISMVPSLSEESKSKLRDAWRIQREILS